MKMLRSSLFRGLFFLFLLTVIFYFLSGSVLDGRVMFDLDLVMDDYMGIFTHLAILALLTERFVEIYASVMRKPRRVELECLLNAAENEAIKTQALQNLNNFKARTGSYTIIISFVTGLILATAGIHILDMLFQTNDMTMNQKQYFDSIDIIITAGLIAGGSKGVNSITSSITAVFTRAKTQATG